MDLKAAIGHYDHLVHRLYVDKIATGKVKRYRAAINAATVVETITIGEEAHALLFSNPDQKTSYLGFVEFIDDPAVVAQLVKACKEQLVGSRRKLYCPVDKTIWYSYRFKVGGSKDLPLEEPHMPYYSPMLRPYFKNRESFASFVAPLGGRKRAVKCKLKIRQLNGAKLKRELESIYSLILRVFPPREHPAPSLDEFIDYHREVLTLLNTKYVWLAEDNNKVVGLCFSFVSKRELFFKTIAVHPAYRRHSVGQALYNSCVALAEKEGCEREYYLFVKNGRLINKLMPKSVEKVADYVLFNKLK